MSKTTENKKKTYIKKSQEIVLKQPSLFRKIVSFITAYSMMFLNITPVFATDITGIQGNNGVYDIDAAKVSGSTGFRQYTNFTLDNGDVANLKFDQGYNKFVNLVDNQVNINGIVNTVKGDAFYNGHAIFVSPNGIVVGASGVLNVGSLTMATPTQGKYNDLKHAYDGELTYHLSDYEHGADKYNDLLKNSEGMVTINGKIMAKENVELYGKDVKVIGDNSVNRGIVAGVKNQSKITTQEQAKQVFDSLVQNNIKDAENFSLEGGKIKIVANKRDGFDSDNDKKLEVRVDISQAKIGANEIDISATADVDRQQRVDLAKATVDIGFSEITGDTVSIEAKSTQKKDFDAANPVDDVEFIINTLEDIVLTPDSDVPPVTSLWGVAGKAEAEVNVRTSIINALKATASDAENPNLSVLIRAEASSETSENANFLTPTLLEYIFSGDSYFEEYFSSDVYNHFEGAKSSAIVNVDNSAINVIGNEAGNIEISTDASSSLDANNRLLSFILPVGIYAVGTETISKAIIKDSILNAVNGDIDVSTVSTNENSTVFTSDSLFSVKLEDGFFLLFLNNTVKTDTEASIINSTVTTDNLSVFATNLSDSYAEISMEAVAGEKDKNDPESTGNSASSAGVILNRSNNNVTALIKDSKITTAEDTTVLAQSLHKTENAPDGSVNDMMVQKPKTFDSAMNKKLKELQGKFFKLNIFNKIKGKTPVVGKEGDNAMIELGGAVVHNNTNNTTTAKIENSDVKADGDVTVRANTVDLLTNTATSDTQGEAKFGVSVALVLSEQNNTTNALIDKSKIEAENVMVDATTELPMNVGSLTFGMRFPFKIMGMDSFFVGGRFASEANGKWSVSPATPKADDKAPVFELSGLAEQNIIASYSGLKPKFKMAGFFNNLAQTNSVGGTASASAAVVYNEVNTNTMAAIQNNSDITANGDVDVNAVNSVIGYNGAGLVDILIKKLNYKLPGQQDWEYEPTVEGGKAGIGANFVFDNYTNHATAVIDNSTVRAEDGNINVDSATEQSYMNIIITGGKSEKIGVDGSIHVQEIRGDTIAKISNIKDNHTVVADNIEVNAGKATIRTTGGSIKRDDKTDEIKWKQQRELTPEEKEQKVDPAITYPREAKDEITNIIVQGSLAQQKEEVENGEQSSSGIAVGASVNTTSIDRNVRATIENSDIEATNLAINAATYNQKVDIEGAAAFSGGVKQKQQDAGNVPQNIDNAQDKEDNKSVDNSISEAPKDDDGDVSVDDENYFKELLKKKKNNNNEDDDDDSIIDKILDQFSLSVAGAVDVTQDDTKVEASVNNSELSIGKDLGVNAVREAKNILLGGAVAKSNKNAAGAAVAYNNQSGFVKSIINNSNIEFADSDSKLVVNADNKNWLLNISIGAGASVNSDEENKGFQSAVGGSLNINTLEPEIVAAIENSSIGTDDYAKNVDVDINAKNKVDVYNIAGGGAYLSGNDANGVGAGAAVNYNNVKNNISAYIANSTLENINNLSILADADNDMNDFAVAGSLVTGAETGWAFDGSADINYIHDTVKAKIMGSTITAKKDIEVKANSNTDNLDAAGTIDILTTGSGAGVNGDVVINVFKNDVTAEIGDSYKIGTNLIPMTDQQTDILQAKDINVAATSTEKVNNILAGAAVSTGGSYLMAAANVNVNLIDNAVKARVSGDLGSGRSTDYINNLNVAAYDETTIYTRGATVSAAASQEAATVIAGSVNVDKLTKTVEAKIVDAKVKARGDVTASAASVNSLGGTKNDNNEYSRDDVTSKEYREKLLHKDADGLYDGLQMKDSVALDQDSDFVNWNMLFDVAGGSNIAVAGAGIGKVIENTVTAEISNSAIKADNVYVLADDYSIKNIIAGTISGSLKGTAGLSVLYTKDKSTTSALIDNGSELDIIHNLTVDAANKKDNHQILITGSGAIKGSLNANIAINDVEDKVFAKIDNQTTDKEIYAENINLNANEDINAAHIVVSGGGASNMVLDVNPIVNTYNATVESAVKNAKIIDAAIAINAQNKIDSLDVSAGVAGVAKGFSGVGVAIKNDYIGSVKSYIDDAVIDTQKDIDIDANSVINANNWVVGGSAAAQGVGVTVNVLLNDVNTTLEAGIKNSKIEKADVITINTNKDKIDSFDNNAIAAALAGQGASAIVNVIKNDFTNTTISYVDNTESMEIGSMEVNSNSDRRTNNINFGLIVTGQGAGLAANALVNDINSATRSYVDAKSKTLNVERNLDVKSNDTTAARNSVVMGSLVGLGGTVGLNINLYNANNLVKSEILSATSGQVDAGSVNMDSELTNALDNTQVDLSLGLAAVPIDVQVIKIGQKTNTYSKAEQISDVNKYLNTAFSMIPQGLSTSTTQSSNLQTGAVSSVNGNLKTVLDSNVYAKSRIRGLAKQDGNDVLTNELNLNSFTLVGTLGSASVGVRDVQIANNTIAEIKGGKVESTEGDVALNAESDSSVKMTNMRAEVSGLQVSGGSDIYENSSETLAQIKDSTVDAHSISVNSKSKSHATIDTTHIAGSIGSVVNVDLVEANDTNKTVSLITGNTNINAKDKLTIHSTVDTDLQSLKLSVPIAGASLVSVMKNDATANTISKAIIENVNGTINTNGLDIITDYDDMSVTARSNIVSVKAINVAEYNDSGAFMNAYFKSGIDSLDGLTLKNTGTTNIIAARGNNQKDISAYGRTHDVSVQLAGIYTGTFANAKTNATSATVLKAKDHTSNVLRIDQYLNSKAKADTSGTKVTLGGVYAVAAEATDKSKMTLDIDGNNTIITPSHINLKHNATTEADLRGYNFALLVAGARLRINSDMEADTIANIGGNFNVKDNNININIDTIRNAKLDKTSGTGGLINIADTGMSNTLKGKSILNLIDLKTDDKQGKNRFFINNMSINTYQVKTTDGSGGFINVSDTSATSTFNTSTVTNVENADINSQSDFNILTKDTTAIEDNASNAGGGLFISYVGDKANNSYSSSAKINIKNSNIKAKDLKLQADSSVTTKDLKDISYTGDTGGFVAVGSISVTNNITNTSEINLQNSTLEAAHNAVLKAVTGSYFKQKIESEADGFVSIAKGTSNLNVTNNNKITIDDKSIILANNELEIDFESPNTLVSRVVSDVVNIGGEPVAKSYLDLTINNTLENGGTLQAGNMLDINFMNGSTNTLTQFAQAVSRAAIATTAEDGKLTKAVNNKIDNKTNANIISGKDIDINYSSGNGESKSVIYWVTKSGWGIITDSGQSSKYDLSSNYNLNNNGKITAAANNSKYMKINRDGSIDKTTLKGFYDGDYILNDGEIVDGAKLKEQKLTEIDIDLGNVNADIDEYNNTLDNYTTIITDLMQQKADVEATISEINSLIEDGAVLLESKAGGSGIYAEISEFDLKMQKDMGCVRQTNTDPGYASKITQSEYNTMMQDYIVALQANEELSIAEFLAAKQEDYGFNTNQINNIVNGYNNVKGRLSVTPHGFAKYVGKDGITYIAALNPTGEGINQSCKNITDLNKQIDDINDKIKSVQYIKDNGEALLADLNRERAELISEYNEIWDTPAGEYDYTRGDYSIVFNDIRGAQDARITINGLTNAGITGTGVFDVTQTGLQVDNYSTRSLVFNGLDTDVASATNSFVINGKSQAEFANKRQAISGQKANEYFYGSSSVWQQNNERPSFDSLPTTGVHYTTESGEISGISITNYYDNNHPLVDTFDIPNPTIAPDITLNGDINTNSLNISNESGNIVINSEDMDMNGMYLFAMNGQIDINVHNDTGNAGFIVRPNDRIFAANGLNINADEVHITSFPEESNIKTGYSVRGITITDKMLKEENLIIDPTTGEKNLIKLKDDPKTSALQDDYIQGNIKAIYKDGKIYLYNLPELKKDNGINIVASKGLVAQDAVVSVGNQSISINNATNKEIVIGDINNTTFNGTVSVSGGVTDSLNAEKHEVAFAQTDITSNGKVTINGKVVNGLDADGNPVEGNPVDRSRLSIRAKNGLNIAKHQTYDTITAGGLVELSNTDNGSVNIYGDITNKKGNTNLYGSDGVSVYGRVHNIDGDVTITAPKGDLILAKGSQIHVDKGNLILDQQGVSGNLNMIGQVILYDGDLRADSFGNITDNGLIFSKEFMDENDLSDLITMNFNEPEIDYVLNNNMGYGYDVTNDKGLQSSVKILRLHKDGATIVNENNWKTGDNIELSIAFKGVDVTAQCKVVKVENGVAQVRFLNLPRSIANKITERYMNKGLFHQWTSD